VRLDTWAALILGATAGIGGRHAITGPGSAQDMRNSPETPSVRPFELPPSASMPSVELHTNGADGPVVVELIATGAVTDGDREGLRLTLKMSDRKNVHRRAQYVVEVVDEYDDYFVGPQTSSVLAGLPDWAGEVEIPPGLPDGNYYVRITMVGVRLGTAVPKGEQDSFSVAKRQYFTVQNGKIQLLDWTSFRERTMRPDEALPATDERSTP
jgi:hypothetical protein